MSDAMYSNVSGRETTDRDDTTYLSALLKRTAWGAVIAGAIAAISLQMLFSVLGIALGATTGDAAGADLSNNGVSIAAGLWWLITGTIALFIGGCIVGRFAGMVRSPDVLLHAFVMWAVTAIFGFAVLSSGSGMVFDKAADAYLNQNQYRGGGFPMMADGQRSADDSRVIRTSDANVTGNTGAMGRSGSGNDARDVSDAEAEQARRVVRNASWWTLVALLIGIGVSLGGAWTTSPNRIVVRPTTAPVHRADH